MLNIHVNRDEEREERERERGSKTLLLSSILNTNLIRSLVPPKRRETEVMGVAHQLRSLSAGDLIEDCPDQRQRLKNSHDESHAVLPTVVG